MSNNTENTTKRPLPWIAVVIFALSFSFLTITIDNDFLLSDSAKESHVYDIIRDIDLVITGVRV